MFADQRVCTCTPLCVHGIRKYALVVLLSCMEIRKSTTEKQVMEEMGEEVEDVREETEDR